MPDVATSLRPSPRADVRLTPDAGAPLYVRPDPWGLFVPTWRETIIFSATVTLTSVEIYASKKLYGPLRVVSLTARCSTAQTTSLRMHVSLVDDDGAAAVTSPNFNNITPTGFGDNSGFLAAFYPTTALTVWPLDRTLPSGTARVHIVANNTSATTQDMFATIDIVYLRPATCDDYGRAA